MWICTVVRAQNRDVSYSYIVSTCCIPGPPVPTYSTHDFPAINNTGHSSRPAAPHSLFLWLEPRAIVLCHAVRVLVVPRLPIHLGHHHARLALLLPEPHPRRLERRHRPGGDLPRVGLAIEIQPRSEIAHDRRCRHVHGVLLVLAVDELVGHVWPEKFLPDCARVVHCGSRVYQPTGGCQHALLVAPPRKSRMRGGAQNPCVHVRGDADGGLGEGRSQ